MVGAGVQVLGQVQQANSTSAAAQYDANRAAQNAIVSRQQAAEDERVYRVGLRKQIGSARASIGASGLQSGGSPADVLSDMAATGELDSLKLKHAGEVKAAGYTSDTNLYNLRAQSAQAGGYLSAGGTLLSSGSKIYKDYA